MTSQDVCFLPIIGSGGMKMVKHEVWHEIHSRFRLKESKKSIARSVGLSVQTVRKILRQKQPTSYQCSRQPSNILSPYEDYIRPRLAAAGYTGRSIYGGSWTKDIKAARTR